MKYAPLAILLTGCARAQTEVQATFQALGICAIVVGVLFVLARLKK